MSKEPTVKVIATKPPRSRADEALERAAERSKQSQHFRITVGQRSYLVAKGLKATRSRASSS